MGLWFYRLIPTLCQDTTSLLRFLVSSYGFSKGLVSHGRRSGPTPLQGWGGDPTQSSDPCVSCVCGTCLVDRVYREVFRGWTPFLQVSRQRRVGRTSGLSTVSAVTTVGRGDLNVDVWTPLFCSGRPWSQSRCACDLWWTIWRGHSVVSMSLSYKSFCKNY